MTDHYRSLSFWHDSLPDDDLTPRAPLDGAASADVVIVGGGYTGLWTAYYLAKAQPDLDVVVLESEVCGFGASGRNGGWATQEVAVRREKMAARHGRDGVVALLRELCDAVDQIGRVAAAEGIDCDYAKGGTVTFATNPAQVESLKDRIAHEHEWGFGEGDFRWLSPAETESIARSPRSLGSVFTPHCAAVHPAKLARGLARVVEGLGVRIYEETRVTSIGPGGVQTERGTVAAPAVLNCTEVFTVELPGMRRRYAPLYTLMIATEPLDDSTWAEIGMETRPTFDDGRHLIVYGQRTADGRFAFGGRGAPYHFGSRLSPEFDRDDAIHDAVEGVLRWMFPQMGEARITHRWGGAVALPRDWQASIGFDRTTGVGYAGGYVGTGVAASNVAGRTLADLVLGLDTDLVHLPWVGHRSPRWEPEPFRWVGINLGRRLLAPAADASEARTGKPSRFLGGALRFLTGR
jgi:glycine/D-amino acid oxidase-like deaminating enzyme